MARAREDSSTLRFSRRECERVMVALLISALLHLAIYGGYMAGHKLGWWQKWRLPARLHPDAKKDKLRAQPVQGNEPEIFVDVSHADADAPARPKYYSNKNSHAANEETANTEAPKVAGRQIDFPKTEDASKPVKGTSGAAAKPSKENQEETPQPENPAAARLQPSPSPLLAARQTPAKQPEPFVTTPGETELPKPKAAEPAPAPAEAASQAQPARPRTLKQALAMRKQIPGQKMRQDGGTPRRALWSSLDAKATPFGDYDAAIVEAVSQRWYDLLDNHRFAEDRTGKVTLRFKLKPDGSVIEVQTIENNVGELLGYLCQESIEESAPFGKWPPDMARLVGANYREITFTFYYY